MKKCSDIIWKFGKLMLLGFILVSIVGAVILSL